MTSFLIAVLVLTTVSIILYGLIVPLTEARVFDRVKQELGD